MAYIRANLFYEREQWKKPLVLSVGFHLALVATILVTGYLAQPRSTVNWGINSGDAVTATLVSAAPLPIPHTEESNNIVANESKGVTETRPQPKPVETEDGISIPGKVTKPKPQKAVTATNVKPPRPAPTPEDTAVPYGEGGPVSGPYGAFTAPHTQGGFSFQNADFGTRFGYYVRAVNQAVSRNWYKPQLTSSHRAYITFDILRNGSVPFTSVQIEQSSGVPAIDQSAVRAVQRSEFGPLPPEYNGSKVSVEFWFEDK
jgi:protein TonB